MPDKPDKHEFLDTAKQQFAQVSAEFEKAMAALKDPERRKDLTSSYLDVLQKGLARAQESVASYQEKFASRGGSYRPDSAPHQEVPRPETPPTS